MSKDKPFRSVHDPGNAPIVGRFPVVAADIGTGAVIDTKIGTGAVTTGKIADDAVTSPKAATGVVDGDTITGSVIQTATSGQRIVMRDDGTGGIIESFSGVASEILPSTLDPQDDGSGLPLLTLTSGTKTGATEKAALLLKTGAAGASRMSVVAENVLMEGHLGADTAVTLTGHLTTSGTGWLQPGAGGGTWGTGWTNAGTTELGAMKRVGNTVTVRGLVWRTSGAGNTIMTLPSGCRPSRLTYRIVLMSNSWAYVSIATSGAVDFAAGGTAITNSVTAIGLDLQFDIDQP